MEIRDHSIDLGLLEHYFRNMDCIEISSLSSRKFTAVFGVSRKDILLDLVKMLQVNKLQVKRLQVKRLQVNKLTSYRLKS